MKRATRKTRKTKSDSEVKEKPKKCVKKVKGQQKKTEQSSDSVPVAGSSRQSDSVEIPKKRTQRRRGKKAHVPEHEDNSDSEEQPQERQQEVNNVEEEERDIKEESIESISGFNVAMRAGLGYHTRSCKRSEALSQWHPETYQKHFKDRDESEEDVKMNDLDHLRKVDPDFYAFLQEHDAGLHTFVEHDHVLDENEDDDDDEIIDIIIGGEEEEPEEDEDADESDFEAGASQSGYVTVEMVQQLEIDFQKSYIKLGTIKKAMRLFSGAVSMATRRECIAVGRFKVTEADVFRSVLDLCVVELPTAIGEYLGVRATAEDAHPQTSEKFVKIKSCLIDYLSDLVTLLLDLSTDSILTSMLKHLHQLSNYVACFSRIAKMALKTLLPLWSHGEQTVRIHAFKCIIQITRRKEQALLVAVLKAMFWTYIKNCKSVSPATWPNIRFMRRSLVEMYKLDLQRSYLLVVFYMRQLGIHLKNAVFFPTKEHKLAIFNWQYINALHLWAELVSQTVHNIGMKSLHFPLVMIISNTIKLGATPQYYPLRFYLIEVLMEMQAASGEVIAIMPFFVDVIKKFDINKIHKEVSINPLDFSCIIRLSKAEMNETGFTDAVVERLHALLFQFTASLSYKMTFPECCTGLLLYFQDLVDKCDNTNYKRKLYNLYNKILENNEYMIKQRHSFTGDMVQVAPIVAWEERMKAEGTPLLTQYEQWRDRKKPPKVSGPRNPKKKVTTKFGRIKIK